MKKRLISLMFILISIFFLNLYNINAQLPDIILKAEAQDNDVMLTWNYSSYGSYGAGDISKNYIKLNFDKSQGEAPLTVNFNIENNFDFTLCQLDYGDLNYDTGYYGDCKNLFQHTYQNAGSYNVVLVSQDLYGNSYSDSLTIIVNEKSSYGSYGSSVSGFSVRNTLNKVRNEITGKSFLDNIGININKLFRKLFFKPVGISLDKYKFEIYRNNLLIDKDTESKYCKDGRCSYNDKNLNFGEYNYYIKILNNEETEIKVSNNVIVKIEQKVGEQINAYITLATTKDYYNKNEKIELTDPPEDGKNLFGLRGTAISKDFVTKENYGYIIQFKQDPILVRKTKIENELENIKLKSINHRQNYEEASKDISALNFFYKIPVREINKFLYSNSQGDYIELQKTIDKTILDYKVEFKQEFENNINKVKQELNLDDDKIIREFEGELFNGIVLNINQEEANEIKKLSNVENVFPNEVVEVVLDKSVPVIKGDVIRKDLGLTGENVTVAIIDTGLDPRHESLDDLDDDLNTNDPKIIAFADFVNLTKERISLPYDDHGHGTHVAGICCGTGGINKLYVGVAPKSKLVGVKVLDGGGFGTFDQVVAGMEWVAKNKDKYNIKIVSMSLGGFAQTRNDPLEYAANALVDSGVTLVVAAGNSGRFGPRTISTPGIAEKAITVGAIDNNLEIAWFSSRGPTVTGKIKPDLVAPGVQIKAPQSDTVNEYVKYSGTSMATPLVSGAVALLYQYNKDFTDKEVKDILYNSALDLGDKGKDNVYGYGVVDLSNAFLQLIKPIHEVSVQNIILDKKFYLANENIVVKPVIKNLGNLQERVKVNMYVNNKLLSQNILDLKAGEVRNDLVFGYTPTEKGLYEIKFEVELIQGELFISNNKFSKELKVFDEIKGEIKAVVLDSWGNDYSQFSIFDELNEEWYNYGNYLVNIDYKTLNKENINYNDIKNSKADVLIISDAWDNGRLTGNNWEFSNEEIEAIKKYVNEGHGIIATTGTFSDLVPNNMRLADLFGIKQDKIGYWADLFNREIQILYKDNLMFDGIEQSNYISSAVLNINDLELDENKKSLILAKSTDDKAQFILNSESADILNSKRINNIYLTNMNEIYNANYLDKKVFYNSIILASQINQLSYNDLRLHDLELNKISYYEKNNTAKVKIKNLGEAQNNIIVDLLVNEEIKKQITLSLNKNEIKEIVFNYTIEKFGLNNIKIYAHELPGEASLFDNYISSETITPRAAIKSINDYGIDTNNDGMYNNFVVDISLDVIEDGYYSATASLESAFGANIAEARTNKFLNKEDNILSLIFDGTSIRALGLDGPYKVKDITVNGFNEYDIYPEYITKFYNYNDFQLSSDLKIVVEIGEYKRLVNESFDIPIRIDNLGIETAYNSILDIYKNSKDEEIKILHKDLKDINPGQEIEDEINFNSDVTGFVNLRFVVNASNDFNQENNIWYTGYNFVLDGPDLTGFLLGGNKIFGIENNVNAIIRNEGVKPLAQSKASLYSVERYYDNTANKLIENLTLIQEIDTGGLAVDEQKEINFTWMPNKTGWNSLRLVLESPEDLNKENNLYETSFLVIYNLPDIFGSINANYLWLVNKSNNIYLYITNNGPKDANDVTGNLYLDDNGNKILIFTKFYEKILSGETKISQISYTIDRSGHFNLIFEINSSDENEIKENNIAISYIRVIPEGADLIINNVERENRNFLIHENVSLKVTVYNLGTEIAKDGYLYAYSNLGELLNSLFIGDVDPKKEKIVNLVIKPSMEGWKSINLVINSSNDVDLDNNNYYTSFKVVPKSLIMNLENNSINGYLSINIEKYNYRDNSWKFYKNVLDDLKENNLRTIEPNSYLALDKIFNPNNVVIGEGGTYRIYVVFLDKNGNIFLTPSGNKLESYYQFIL